MKQVLRNHNFYSKSYLYIDTLNILTMVFNNKKLILLSTLDIS